MQSRAGELLDAVMDDIAASKSKASAEATASASSDKAADTTHAKAKVKPVRVVSTSDIVTKTYLESEEEVEAYISKLRTALMTAIAEGYRTRVQ
jgi:hypothetical protein